MGKVTDAFFNGYCLLRHSGYTVGDLEKMGIDCRIIESYYQKFRSIV